MGIREDFSDAIVEKVRVILKKEYEVDLDTALQKNPEFLIKLIIDSMYFLLDTDMGEALLFQGLNRTSQLYRTAARYDKFYRYVGMDSINYKDLVPEHMLEVIEKDAHSCEDRGCSSGGRPLWCVKDVEGRDGRSQMMCNFCAQTQGLGGSLDRCLSLSDECHTCACGKLAREINGSNGQVVHLRKADLKAM